MFPPFCKKCDLSEAQRRTGSFNPKPISVWDYPESDVLMLRNTEDNFVSLKKNPEKDFFYLTEFFHKWFSVQTKYPLL